MIRMMLPLTVEQEVQHKRPAIAETEKRSDEFVDPRAVVTAPAHEERDHRRVCIPPSTQKVG